MNVEELNGFVSVKNKGALGGVEGAKGVAGRQLNRKLSSRSETDKTYGRT